MKKPLIKLVSTNGMVEIWIYTKSLVFTSVLTPKQAKMMAKELLKVAQASEAESNFPLTKENVIRADFKKRKR